LKVKKEREFYSTCQWSRRNSGAGYPGAIGREQAESLGLMRYGYRRIAAKVARYKPQQTEVRPPENIRLPLCLPLSWLLGATPTSRAICFSKRVPSSGNSARQRALMAKMQIASNDRPKVKAECLRLLATLRLDPARSQFVSIGFHPLLSGSQLSISYQLTIN
jgi:hypothetical protein